MNSEHRHELAQNELAEGVEGILEWIAPYWRAIAGLAVLLCAVAFSYGYISSTQRQVQESGWNAFVSASANSDTKAWEEISKNYQAEPVGLWSQYSAAQAHLIEGSILVHRDREAARKDLNVAVDGFEKVLAQKPQQLLRERAYLGLSQALEGLNEPAKAKETLEALLREFPKGAVAQQAQERIAVLSDPKHLEFLQWFFTHSPPSPQAKPAGSGGDFPTVPFGDLPSGPNISVPNPLSPTISAPGTGGPSDDDLVPATPTTTPTTPAVPEGETSAADPASGPAPPNE